MARLLIIEKNSSYRRSLKDLLHYRTPAYAVYEASGYEVGLAGALKLNPDLVLLGLGLPAKDGLEALKSLKTHLPDAAFLVLSYSVLPEYREAAMIRGADFYFAKEFVSPEELLRTVGAALSSRLDDSGGEFPI